MADRPTGRDISVIIPVLDHAALIGEAIESVLSQTEPPGEVVVVDDGSSDGSGDVARSFGDRVRVVRQETLGIGGARNRGVAETHRPLLAFLDADDRWVPDKLRRQLMLLGPEVDVVTGLLAQVLQRDWATVIRDGAPREMWALGSTCETLLLRRTAFERVGPFALRFRAGEFLDWFDRARTAGLRFAPLAEAVVFRRVHDQGHGVRNPAVYRDYLDVVQAAVARKRGREAPS